MLNTVRLISRRFLRQPQSFDLMLRYSAGRLAAPPLPRGWHGAYEKTLVGINNDEPILDRWRSEFRKTVREISDERPWIGQKRKLLWHLVKEAGWVALFTTVEPTTDLRGWRGFVADVDMFKGYDDRYQYAILQQRYMLAHPTYMALLQVGKAAFALDKRTALGLTQYFSHRKMYISTMLLLGEHHDLWSSEDNEVEPGKSRYRRLDELVKEIIALDNRIADAVICEAYEPASIRQDIADLEITRLRVLRSVGIEPDGASMFQAESGKEAQADSGKEPTEATRQAADEAESQRLFRKLGRKAWLRGLMSRPDPAVMQRAKEERAQAFAVAKQVYLRNLRAFLNNLSNQLFDMMNAGYNYNEVNDAFLWGIFEQFLKDRPSLPTEPHMRLMLHLSFFISEEEQIPFVTARERVWAIETKRNDARTDGFIREGRLACEDTGDEHLIKCHSMATNAAAPVASF